MLSRVDAGFSRFAVCPAGSLQHQCRRGRGVRGGGDGLVPELVRKRCSAGDAAAAEIAFLRDARLSESIGFLSARVRERTGRNHVEFLRKKLRNPVSFKKPHAAHGPPLMCEPNHDW